MMKSGSKSHTHKQCHTHTHTHSHTEWIPYTITTDLATTTVTNNCVTDFPLVPVRFWGLFVTIGLHDSLSVYAYDTVCDTVCESHTVCV